MADETKTGTAAGAASGTSDDATSKAGQSSTQPANGGQVDTSKAEDKGNAASSDGGDGADGAGEGRQRPGRAERRISELTARIKELEESREKGASLSDQLKKTPTGDIQLPDLSSRTEITPDDYKKDVISAASQILDLKMPVLASELEKNLNVKSATEKNLTAIESTIAKYDVLNPKSDAYDSDLDHEISDAYADVAKTDPSFSFDKFIKPFTRVLDTMSTETASTTSNRGTSANRGSTATSKKSAVAFDENWSTARMEEYFASKR